MTNTMTAPEVKAQQHKTPQAKHLLCRRCETAEPVKDGYCPPCSMRLPYWPGGFVEVGHE